MDTKPQRQYRGWTCWLDHRGVYRAIQYGVSVCANHWEELYHVIDHHIEARELHYRTVKQDHEGGS
jgi:hypothetical protein